MRLSTCCHHACDPVADRSRVLAVLAQHARAFPGVPRQSCAVKQLLRRSKPRICWASPLQIVASGPNRRSGKFKRISTCESASTPEHTAQTEEHSIWPIGKIVWMCVTSVAVACTVCSLSHNRTATKQLNAEPRPATMASIVSSAEQRGEDSLPSSTATACFNQQPAFASISVSSFTGALSHLQRTHMVQTLVYQIQRLLTMNIMTKLISVILLSLPLIGVGGFFYQRASGSSWREAFFKCYVVLQNVPGADATVEANQRAALVLHSVFQLGLLTFAVVLGVVCSDISAAVESIQSGNYAVVESGHTVILNWNKLTIPVLRQMAVARAEQQVGTFKGPVVVLADMDKAEMDAAVARGLQGPRSMEVLTRSGRPHSIADLEKAAAGRARIIMMLHPEDSEGAAQRKVAAITGIEALGGGAKAGQNLLIQSGPESSEDDALVAIASQGSLPKHMKLGLIEMKDQERMDRLISQCAVQPGLGKVYSQLLLQSHTSAEFYLKDMFPSLVGRSYAEARRSFDSAVLCGVLDSNTGQAELNPSDVCMLDTHHRLVFLSSTAHIKPSKQALSKASRGASHSFTSAPSASHTTSQEAPEIRQGKNIIVIGWNMDQTVEGLVQGLADFAPPGSSVTIVSPDEPGDLPSECGNCRCRHVEGSVTSQPVLLEAGVADADAVILRMPLHSLADNDADAQVVASLIQLQDLAIQSGRASPLHVVAPVRHPRTIGLINYITMHSHNAASHSQTEIGAVKAVTDNQHQHASHASHNKHHRPIEHAGSQAQEHKHTNAGNMGGVGRQGVVMDVDVLLPDELLSGLLTQVSVQPELLSVMNDLFDAEGAEIYLRNPSRYQLPLHTGRPLTFSEVSEAARQHGETALGYILQDGTVISAPNPNHKQALHVDDQVIALAEQA